MKGRNIVWAFVFAMVFAVSQTGFSQTLNLNIGSFSSKGSCKSWSINGYYQVALTIPAGAMWYRIQTLPSSYWTSSSYLAQPAICYDPYMDANIDNGSGQMGHVYANVLGNASGSNTIYIYKAGGGTFANTCIFIERVF